MKSDRQRAILDLVRQRPVHTQQELARALAQRGFSATQATVSRDIQELGLVRTGDGYAVGRPPTIVSELVLSVPGVSITMKSNARSTALTASMNC